MALHTYHNMHLAAAIFVLVTLARAACFLPNGTDRNWIYNSSAGSAAYLPCQTSPDGDASMCCRLGDGEPETCRPDGLCQSDNRIWRESCNDNTWKAKGCIRLCIDGSMSNDDVKLRQCDDKSFCCDQDGSGEQCCNRGQGRWLDGNGGVVDTKPASMGLPTGTATTTSQSATSTQVPASAPASSSASPSSSSKSSNTGAIAGGVVACVVGGMIIAGGLFLLVKHHKTGRNPCPSHESPEDPGDVPVSAPVSAPASEAQSASISTLPESVAPAAR